MRCCAELGWRSCRNSLPGRGGANQDPGGQTALHWAALNGHTDALQVFAPPIHPPSASKADGLSHMRWRQWLLAEGAPLGAR